MGLLDRAAGRGQVVDRERDVDRGVFGARQVPAAFGAAQRDVAVANGVGGQIAAARHVGPAAVDASLHLHRAAERRLGRGRPRRRQQRCESIELRRIDRQLPLVARVALGGDLALRAQAVAGGGDLELRLGPAVVVDERQQAFEWHAGEHAVVDRGVGFAACGVEHVVGRWARGGRQHEVEAAPGVECVAPTCETAVAGGGPPWRRVKVGHGELAGGAPRGVGARPGQLARKIGRGLAEPRLERAQIDLER